jgi:hypothetical protein
VTEDEQFVVNVVREGLYKTVASLAEYVETGEVTWDQVLEVTREQINVEFEFKLFVIERKMSEEME